MNGTNRVVRDDGSRCPRCGFVAVNLLPGGDPGETPHDAVIVVSVMRLLACHAPVRPDLESGGAGIIAMIAVRSAVRAD
jgi:hypothetical protein